MDLHLPRAPIPVFPLAGVFLFPHQVLPLNIFEPRYRQMIEDMLDGPGWLAIASPRTDEVSASGQPALPPVAGLGEILHHDRQPDGRFLIKVLGRARVRIHEVPSPNPYRLVTCTPFAEVDVAAAEVPRLAQRLRAATSARLRQELPLPDDAPVSLLADLLLQTLGMSADVMERAFTEPSVAARAHFVLHAARGKRPRRQAEEEE